MTFNSLAYLPFLAVAFIAFRLAPERWRWFVLLVASILFYASLDAPYLLLALALVTITTYLLGLGIARVRSDAAKRLLLTFGAIFNILVLVTMRYWPAVSDGAASALRKVALPVSLPAPEALVVIGVSYYVFQAISYLADVFLEVTEPERHLGYFALYLAFFPKILQGPIERADELIPQLRARFELDYDNCRSGALLFTWGLFKKVVIADRLALYADTCYGNLSSFTGISLVIATWIYAFQIYMDFSGYTDMALGSARIFNIELTQNFRGPYLARSIVDFWRRWHISLSRWIGDYIFQPLQLTWRAWGAAGTAAALVITFVACGLWHGPTVGFLIWGAIHGVYMAGSALYTPWERRILKARGIEKGRLVRTLEVILTFNLVSFAWIFFRADTLDDASYVVRHAFDNFDIWTSALWLSQGMHELIVTTLLVAATILASFNVDRYRDRFARITAFRWAVYYALILCILSFGTLGESDFLYFRF